MKRKWKHQWLVFLKLILAVVLLLLISPHNASSYETYKFERMWPTLQQPWYFTMPYDVAIDGSGFVYVADTYKHRVQKFTSDGQFVFGWGNQGTGDGKFNFPWSIAIDGSGHIYVVDGENHRIQKFSPDGQFVHKWGSLGSSDGQFAHPCGIAVDSSGFVYVADRFNYRIQKFTADGEFITKWGGMAPEMGNSICHGTWRLIAVV